MTERIDINAFCWKGFEKLIAPPAAKLAKEVINELIEMGCDEDSEEECFDLFQQDKDAVDIAREIYCSDNWYPSELGLEPETYDNLVMKIFETEELPGLKLETLGCHINPLFPEYVAGWFDLVPSSRSPEEMEMKPLEPGSALPDTESRWVGCRPFRNAGWLENIPLNIHPDELIRKYHIPAYSIHTPEEVHKLHAEASALEEVVEDWPNEDLAEQFISEYLEPLEIASRNNLAIYCWANN